MSHDEVTITMVMICPLWHIMVVAQFPWHPVQPIILNSYRWNMMVFYKYFQHLTYYRQPQDLLMEKRNIPRKKRPKSSWVYCCRYKNSRVLTISAEWNVWHLAVHVTEIILCPQGTERSVTEDSLALMLCFINFTIW